MSFEYIVHATKDPDGELPLPGLDERLRSFTNRAYAFHYAETLAMAYPDGYVMVQVEYREG